MSTDTFSKLSTIEVFKRVGLACLAQTSTHSDTLDSDVSSCAGRVIDKFLFSFYSSIFLGEFCTDSFAAELQNWISTWESNPSPVSNRGSILTTTSRRSDCRSRVGRSFRFDRGLGFDSRLEILLPISAAKLSMITD